METSQKGWLSEALKSREQQTDRWSDSLKASFESLRRDGIKAQSQPNSKVQEGVLKR